MPIRKYKSYNRRKKGINMKKSLIALSVVTAFATTSFSSDANAEMYKQIQALK